MPLAFTMKCQFQRLNRIREVHQVDLHHCACSHKDEIVGSQNSSALPKAPEGTYETLWVLLCESLVGKDIDLVWPARVLRDVDEKLANRRAEESLLRDE